MEIDASGSQYEEPISLTRRANDPKNPDTFEFEAVIEHHTAQGPQQTQQTPKLIVTDFIKETATEGTTPPIEPTPPKPEVQEKPSLLIGGPLLNLETEFVVNTYQASEDTQYRLPFIGLRTSTGHTLLALVDTGATVSLIDHASAERVGLVKITEQEVTINCFSRRTSHTANIYMMDLKRNKSRDPWRTKIIGTPRLPDIKFQAPKLTEQDKQLLLSKKIGTHSLLGLRVFSGYKIDMILGNDKLYWVTKSAEKFDLPSGRRVEKTLFGLIVYPTPAKEQEEWMMEQIMTIKEEEEKENWRNNCLAEDDDHPSSTLSRALNRMFDVELIGIEAPKAEDDASDKTKRDLIEEFNNNVVMLETGELQVPFPWNGNESRLSDNFTIAKVRLSSLYEKLKNGPKGYLEEYDKIIRNQLASGIIEEVTDLHRQEKSPVYYIPHKEVVKTDSLTTKIRIVLDASSRGRGKLSLNDCQFPGPSILESIFGILLRARMHPNILVADIEKAFHQVRLLPECRNATRFLWVNDLKKRPTKDNTVEYRFARLPFGVTSSPFLLAATIKYFLDRETNTSIAADIQQNLYVDNVLFTASTKEVITAKYKESKAAFEKMRMNLREYITNSKEAMESIPEDDKASSSTIKLLGYKWDSLEDTFTVKIAEMKEARPTKRQVASRLHQTFDPLGLVTPLIIELKLLMQNLWVNGISWNHPIPQHLVPAWNRIKANYAHTAITVPRQMTHDYTFKSVQLLMFSDANKEFYACAGYLHYEFDNRPPITRLLVSKAKVRPSKSVSWTIPKMELMGIEIASTIACAIQQELKVPLNGVKFFSDSMCAIYWILLNEKKRAWVSNRVAKIHANRDKLKELGLQPTIHHCPGDMNPADLATRGLGTADLQQSELWFHGPKFLRDDPKDWPCAIQGDITCPADFREVVYGEIIEGGKSKKTRKAIAPKAKQSEVEHVLTYGKYEETCMTLEDSGLLKSIIPYECTNSMMKLVTIVTLLLQAIKKMFPKHEWKGGIMKEFCETTGDPLAHERKIARKFIIEEHYKDIGNQNLKFPGNIEPILCPDRLYRIARPTGDTPILINTDHKLARLLVLETHIVNEHAPQQYLVNALRTKYWIPLDGMLAKKMIRSCVNCRRIKEKPFAYPYSKILPNMRTAPSAPFMYCGLDYFGPLPYYKDNGEKDFAQVLLYTCLVTRAVHLELLRNGTTREYIKGLLNIFSRRGVPKSILSDNARTFTLGAKLINRNIVEQQRPSTTFTELLAREAIDFHHITPLAPWQGGVYERIVGLVKNQLFKVIRRQVLDFFDLQHTLIRVEGLLNNRPISQDGSTPNDVVAVRPIDFLLPKVYLDVPSHTDIGPPTWREGITEARTREHHEKLDNALAEIWTAWSTGYLTALRDSIGPRKRSTPQLPRVGEVVIVTEQLIPRNKWPLARIVKLVESKDGIVRNAIIYCKGMEFQRAINQLIPLEISDIRPQGNKQTKRQKQVATKDHPAPEVPRIDIVSRLTNRDHDDAPASLQEDQPNQGSADSGSINGSSIAKSKNYTTEPRSLNLPTHFFQTSSPTLERDRRLQTLRQPQKYTDARRALDPVVRP